VTDLEQRVRAAIEPHPAVISVELAGSRARGEETPLSDWDFQVETRDFEALAAALPQLVEPLEPLSRQWDRYSPHPTYMLMLHGPLKLDLLFLGRLNQKRPPWEASASTLAAIDDHFWDWVLWMASKRDDRLLRKQRSIMGEQLLAPLGVPDAPTGVEDAVAKYLGARRRAEREFGVKIDCALGEEVMRGLRASGYDVP
jgi:hypothetical protein